jgi:hypothetical protein
MNSDYEKLGAFYLGREVDPATGQDHPEPLLLDARDLTTHAVCVGMTGSGKTGLCLGLIEEAAIDGVPVLCIDPKGDIADLLLTFPKLAPADFLPWIDAADAARHDQTPDQWATQTAAAWKQGLADWGQAPERIQRLRDAAEVSVYTPGGGPGLALSVLRSLDPPPELLGAADAGAQVESINAVVAALLALLKVESDPVRGRESILLARIVQEAWAAGHSLDLAGLIHAIQKPGFEQLGAFDLETFYPAKDRLELAMSVNSLLASPGFAAWTTGEPLDVQRLLYTNSGRPRICIISIAHLGDAERMFVVTLLLNALVAWMRRQPGTSSLRALLYMDEIFGYFPPSANPPAKAPMLTLLKQARAFGLGCILATQNPVDLDYRGLANAGTWLIGRLQTERDKARVIEGLTSALGGSAPDKGALEALMSSLRPRLFLMRRAQDDAPRLIRSRWTLSWLRGPLTAAELGTLMAPQRATRAALAGSSGAAGSARSAGTAGTAAATAGAPGSATALTADTRPVLPPGIREIFLPATGTAPGYRLAVQWSAKLHFVDSKHGVDAWQTLAGRFTPPTGAAEPDWAAGSALADAAAASGSDAPAANARFAAPPASALRAANWRDWSQAVAAHLYEEARAPLQYCETLKQASQPGEEAGAFRARLALALREQRDAQVDALRAQYAPRLANLQTRLQQAQLRAQREHAQATQQTLSAAVAVGATLLSAFLGRKAVSMTTVSRAATAVRGATRIGAERQQAAQADESVAGVQAAIGALQAESEAALSALKAKLDPASLPLEALAIAPRKGDTTVGELLACWVPG